MTTEIIISLIIFSLALVSFALQKIPAGLTALTAGILMVVFGFLEPSELLSCFGNDTVVMVMCCIILGEAMFETGAASAIGGLIVRHFTANARQLLIVLVLLSAFLSAFLSNTAVTAMFIPLLATVTASSEGRITRKGTYMAVGIASVVGGNCTLAGSTPQMVAQGILSVTEGVRELRFWELSKAGVPLVLLLVVYYWLIGESLQRKVFGPDETQMEEPDTGAPDAGGEKSRSRQFLVALILAGCIAGFTLDLFTLGTVALIGAVLCMLTGCISFTKAFKSVDWNTVMVLAGATAMSMGLNKSGFISLAAQFMIGLFGGSSANPRVLCIVIILLSALFGNIMSHTATASALVPLGISIALGLQVDAIPFVVAVVIGSNLAFATPIATPPLTMTLVGGYRFTDYTIVGGLYNIFALILACLLIPSVYPF